MSSEMEGNLPDGDDLLAAEYVLGVQSADVRAELMQRISRDNEFAARVAAWELRLSPLNEEYNSVTPPASVKAALDARLFPTEAKPKSGLWHSLPVWRGVAAGALALCAAVVGPALLTSSPTLTAEPIIAPMQAAETGEVRFIAYYETGSNEIRISQINSDKASDRDYELWLIEADGIPRSMGVIPDDQSVRLVVSEETIARINAGDTFAVSIEPLGGSPTGEVTGPVIAAGVSTPI